MKVLVTGSQGFIGTYLCLELLKRGHSVVGIDNYSKYGKVKRPHDNDPNFTLLEMDVLDINREMWPQFKDIEYIISVAALIGGITYFHKYSYDLLATNERINASIFDMSIWLYQNHKLKKIVALSSSMVYENTNIYPTPEDEVYKCPPPISTYGLSKLATEYFCRGAYEQYGLPYTIIRPFNCVGVGEEDAIGEHKIKSGNIKLMMSHVLPDLVNKTLQGQSPLHILGQGSQIRCFTNGKDIARGIYLAMISSQALNEDFNISTPTATTVLELAEQVWNKINNKPFDYVCDVPFKYDVQKRIPNVEKAKKLLEFEATIGLDESIDEVINYIKNRDIR